METLKVLGVAKKSTWTPKHLNNIPKEWSSSRQVKTNMDIPKECLKFGFVVGERLAKWGLRIGDPKSLWECLCLRWGGVFPVPTEINVAISGVPHLQYPIEWEMVMFILPLLSKHPPWIYPRGVGPTQIAEGHNVFSTKWTGLATGISTKWGEQRIHYKKTGHRSNTRDSWLIEKFEPGCTCPCTIQRLIL